MKKFNSIGFVLLGAGSVGRGIFHQSLVTPNVNCQVVCDIDLNKALACIDPKRPTKVVSSEGEIADVLKQNMIAVCQDAQLAAIAPGVNVFFDASTAIEPAPKIIESAIVSKKHIIMMNAEADAIFGPWFLHLAQKNGVAYTSSDGDQPAVIARLVEELCFYGLELVMAGNIKGFLDRYANPIKIRHEADKRGLDHQMCSSYTDGSKLCIEMSIVANSMDGSVVKAGMIGPKMAEVTDMFSHFSFSDMWKTGDKPLVDYILGAKPKGGVFAVGYTDDAYQRRMLDWFPPEIGPGPFYVLTRPYHLIHLEAMRTVIEANTTGKSLIAPRFGMRTEVICYAKKNLREGEILDGPGGFASYGLIENRIDGPHSGLPIITSKNAKLSRAVSKDDRIEWNDVDISSISPTVLDTWQKACNVASD